MPSTVGDMNIICIFATVEGFLILEHKCFRVFKLLVVSYLTENVCETLLYGVMVALQILVLSE